MISLRRNVIANFAGQGWSALMGIVFVPFYIRALGAETYGLIGVFALMQAWMALLDLGLTPTLNREMARYRSGAHTPASIRNLLRSLELIYCILAFLLIAVVWMSASYLATHWLKTETLSIELVVFSIRVMGFVLATRLLEQVYRGALQGMQDQVWLNAVQALLATARWGGAAIMVGYVVHDVIAFFLWQGAVSLISTAILVSRTYILLPKTTASTRFSLNALKEVYGFASGMFVGSILSLLLTQGDKVIISKLLPLKEFGHYMLVTTVTSGLLQLILPMSTAVYPKLTEHVTRRAFAELETTYEVSCQWLAAIIVPPALVLTLFSSPVMFAWTGDGELAKSVSLVLSFMALGTLLNGLMNLPYMLQLAHGWTRLSIKMNAVAVIVVIPTLLAVVPEYGTVGAALVWLGLNAFYVVVTAHLMHREILNSAKANWYRHAVLMPLIGGGIGGTILRMLLPAPTSRLQAGVIVAIAGTLLTGIMMATLPRVREVIISRLPFGSLA